MNHKIENWRDILHKYYFYSMIEERVIYFNGDISVRGKRIPFPKPRKSKVTGMHLLAKKAIACTTPKDTKHQNIHDYKKDKDIQRRLDRRWAFLASLENDPLIIDGILFKFDWKLYTSTI